MPVMGLTGMLKVFAGVVCFVGLRAGIALVDGKLAVG
jgi:hypothetical protein